MILDSIYETQNFGKGWWGYNIMPRAPAAVFVELLVTASLVMALVLTPLTRRVVQKLWHQREVTWHAPMFVGNAPVMQSFEVSCNVLSIVIIDIIIVVIIIITIITIIIMTSIINIMMQSLEATGRDCCRCFWGLVNRGAGASPASTAAAQSRRLTYVLLSLTRLTMSYYVRLTYVLLT